MNLNESQEAQVARIADAAERYRNAKARADEEARRIAAERVLSFQIEMDKEVALGRAMGVPWKQLAERGIGTRNHRAAKESAERGAPHVGDLTPPEVEAKGAVKFEAGMYEYDMLARLLTVAMPDGDEQQFALEINDLGAEVLAPVNDEWGTPAARHVLSEAGKAEALSFIRTHTE